MNSQPFDDIRALIDGLKPADEAPRAASIQRLRQSVGPGALGLLEPMIDWIGAWSGASRLNRPIIALYAGGRAGVDPDETRAGMEAIAAGAASVSRAAAHLGAGLDVFDLALDRPVPDPVVAASMSERQCAATLAFGMEAVAKQPDLLVVGAIGAGADFSAAALARALCGGGRPDGFAGAQDARLAAAVTRGRAEAGDDPLQLLRQLGGREIAAICGAIVAAGTARTPVLLDGYPAAAAAAVLHAIRPEAIAHCRVGQAIADPGYAHLLEQIGLSPLLDLGITLEDGTGSTAALALIKLACSLPMEETV
jgi:nicotinate-nucleotide--dimethylbenzimidazole phosphoribosyltransferase